jgi:ADP-heptose:LPS heptosyltransferase
VPPARAEKFRFIADGAKDRLRVGIVWSGSVTFRRNHERAQRLVRFLQAFVMPGVQLYSLQKGPQRREISELAFSGTIIDLAPKLNDFADTAAALDNLDLVIMTDSAVAHLAGAMGKPVWVLLGDNAHWLWLLDRADTPWYSSLRLFRPRGNWDSVFDDAAAELMELSSARRAVRGAADRQ